MLPGWNVFLILFLYFPVGCLLSESREYSLDGEPVGVVKILLLEIRKLRFALLLDQIITKLDKYATFLDQFQYILARLAEMFWNWC